MNKTAHTETEAISRFRSQFELSRGFIHLNNAGQAPMCKAARETIEHWARTMSEQGAHCFPALFQGFDQARQDLAALLGCKANELAFSQSAATAISQIALGFDLKPGDEILVWDQEYPSNFYPWKVAAERAGAKLVIVPSTQKLETPFENIEKLTTSRTRVIATSWVQYRSGAMIDLKRLSEFARPKGIFTSVDIIQGAGCLPFDFNDAGIDAACGASHKWLASSHSPGFFSLREEHYEKIRPLMVGAMTFGSPDDLANVSAKMKPGPSRFEPGGLPFIDVLALGATARMVRDIGILNVAQEAEWLTRKLMHGLREHGYEVHSPHGAHFRGCFVNFTPGPNSALKTLDAVASRLNEKRVSYGRRLPGIRLSPHAFNRPEEIEMVLKALSV